MACHRSSRIFQVHPTRLCNLRCLHCYSASGPEERGELSIALLRDAVSDAAAQGYGVMSVSGGEPLLYRPLRELLDHAHACGMVTTVTSNGMLLDDHRLETLRGAVDLLALSLDGVPESHDRMRADRRAFSTLASRLPGIRSSGIPFGFIFTLTQHNLHELEWVAQFALASGARLLQIHPLEKAGRAAQELDAERPDGIESAYALLLACRLQEELGDRLHVQLDLVSRGGLASDPDHYSAGTTTAAPDAPLADLVSVLVVEADGSVVPLEHGFAPDLRLGNLHQARLRDLVAPWRRDRYPRLQDLCRTAKDDCARQEIPVACWSEALRQAQAGASTPP
ncbi:MAG TPA: radical SAM protein [Thermoanaerobaculia bacterium]